MTVTSIVHKLAASLFTQVHRVLISLHARHRRLKCENENEFASRSNSLKGRDLIFKQPLPNRLFSEKKCRRLRACSMPFHCAVCCESTTGYCEEINHLQFSGDCTFHLFEQSKLHIHMILGVNKDNFVKQL